MSQKEVGNIFGVFEVKQGASMGRGEAGNETKEQKRGGSSHVGL